MGRFLCFSPRHSALTVAFALTTAHLFNSTDHRHGGTYHQRAKGQVKHTDLHGALFGHHILPLSLVLALLWLPLGRGAVPGIRALSVSSDHAGGDVIGDPHTRGHKTVAEILTGGHHLLTTTTRCPIGVIFPTPVFRSRLDRLRFGTEHIILVIIHKKYPRCNVIASGIVYAIINQT